MSTIKERLDIRGKYKAAKERTDASILGGSTFLAGISYPLLMATQASLTYLTQELNKETDINTVKFAAIVAFSLANFASIAIETKTIKDKKYCVSPVANTANVMTGNSVISSCAGHFANFMLQAGLNPVHYFNANAYLAGDGGKLFFENMAMVALVNNGWKIGNNILILNDKMEPAVNGVRKIRGAMGQIYRRGVKDRL